MFNTFKKTYLEVQKHYKSDADVSSKERNRYYIFYIMRPLSIPFTVVAYNLGITSNQATFTGNILILISTIMLLLGADNKIAIMVIYNLYCIFDHVDGNLARLYGTSSQFGKYYDGLSDHLGQKPFVIALGIYAFYSYENIIWVLLAFLSIFIEEVYVYLESRFSLMRISSVTSDSNIKNLSKTSSLENDETSKINNRESLFRVFYRILLKNRNIINFPLLTILFLTDYLALYLIIFLFSQLFCFLPRIIKVFLEAKKELS